jgi:acyl carrier protein
MLVVENEAARKVLAQAFNLAPDDIPDDAALDNFEPWDSLGHIQVLTAIEAALNRTLETEETIFIVDLASLQETLNESSAQH